MEEDCVLRENDINCVNIQGGYEYPVACTPLGLYGECDSDRPQPGDWCPRYRGGRVMTPSPSPSPMRGRTFFRPPRGPRFNGPQRYEPDWPSMPPPQHIPHHGMGAQQPVMVPQQPVMVPHQPGMVPHQPGIVPHQPGMVSHQPGMVPQQPVMVPQQPVMVPQQPIIGPQQPLMGHQQPLMGHQQIGPQQPVMGAQQPAMGQQHMPQQAVMECAPYDSPPNMMNQQGVIMSSYESSPTLTAQAISYLQSLEPGQEIWVKAKSDDGRFYYYHSHTRDTTWTRPDEGPLCKIITQGELEVIVANYQRMQTATSQPSVVEDGLSPDHSQTTISSTPAVMQPTYFTHPPTWHSDGQHSAQEWQPVHVAQDNSYVPAEAMLSLSNAQDEELMHPAAAGYPPMMPTGPPPGVESMTDVVNQGGPWSWGTGPVAPAWPPPQMMPMQSQHQQMPLHHTQMPQYQMQVPPQVLQAQQHIPQHMPPHHLQAWSPNHQDSGHMQTHQVEPHPQIQPQQSPQQQTQQQTQQQAQEHPPPKPDPPPKRERPLPTIPPELEERAAEWTTHMSPYGRNYYYHEGRKESVWIKPAPLKELDDLKARIASILETRKKAENADESVIEVIDVEVHEAEKAKKKAERERRKLEKERLEKEKADKEKAEKEIIDKIEKEKLEMENKAKEMLEMEKEKEKKKENIEKQNIEKQNIEKQNIEKQNIEKQNIEKKNIEKQNIEKKNLEKKNIEKKNIEKKNTEKENIEPENIESNDLETDRGIEEKDKQKDQQDITKPISSIHITGSNWRVVWTGDCRVFFYDSTAHMSVWQRPVELMGRPDVDKAVSLPPQLLMEKQRKEGNDQSEFESSDSEPESNKTKEAEVATRAAAVEAEVRAARERALVPLEQRVASFRQMLLDQNVSAFSTWEKELHKIVFDERYLLITSNERKQVFEKFVRERVEEERKGNKSRLQQKKNSFRQLMEEVKLHSKSSFSDFSTRYGKDVRYRGIDKARDREAYFNEYIAEVRRREKEDRERKKEMIKSEFLCLLREKNVDRHARWVDVKKKIEGEARYKAVDGGAAREDYFQDYCRILKEERKREKDAKEKDRQPRASTSGVKKEKKDRDKDRKDRKDKQAEVKQANVKQAEVKQAQVKQAEIKQGEIKQAEVKQAEVKQVEVKQAEVKQAEVKQAEVKQAEMLPPASQPDAPIVAEEDKEKEPKKMPTPPPEKWAEIIGIPENKKKGDKSALKSRLSPKRLRSSSHKESSKKKRTQQVDEPAQEEVQKKKKTTQQVEEPAEEEAPKKKKMREVKIELKKLDLKKKKRLEKP